MTKFAVVKAGGKQYLVKENDEIIVDKIEAKEKDKLELDKLAEFNDEQVNLQLGTPLLKDKVNVQVITQPKYNTDYGSNSDDADTRILQIYFLSAYLWIRMKSVDQHYVKNCKFLKWLIQKHKKRFQAIETLGQNDW